MVVGVWRLALVGTLLSSGSAALAQYAAIYGGPAFNPTDGTGFQNCVVPKQQLGVNSNGIAIGSSSKLENNTNLGGRAVRWDLNGNATELGNLGVDSGGNTTANAFAINASGIIVGTANTYSNGTLLYNRAVRWDSSGTAATQLGDLGTNPAGITFAYARAVNSSGVIVGNAAEYNGHSYSQGERAVRWDAGGTAATELGNLGTSTSGYCLASALALNDSGNIVGYAEKYSISNDLGSRAVRWDAGTTAAIELGNLGTTSSGSTQSGATAINSPGTAIGYANRYKLVQTSDGVQSISQGSRPVRWGAGTTIATELGNLGTDAAGVATATARAINNSGTIVGNSQKYIAGVYLGTRAVRWDANSTLPVVLGDLGTTNSGYTTGNAVAINDEGFSVGTALKCVNGSPVAYVAALWNTSGNAIDLNALIDPSGNWTLTEADSISDTGFIAGVGLFDPDGIGPQPAYARSFVLDASSTAPEPSAVELLGACSLLLVFARRSRRASASCGMRAHRTTRI